MILNEINMFEKEFKQNLNPRVHSSDAENPHSFVPLESTMC